MSALYGDVTGLIAGPTATDAKRLVEGAFRAALYGDTRKLQGVFTRQPIVKVTRNILENSDKMLFDEVDSYAEIISRRPTLQKKVVELGDLQRQIGELRGR